MVSYLLLLAGFVLLVFAGDALVKGATAGAVRLSIPPIIVGLTIVAFGTSAPELLVSLDAVLTGRSELAVSNVVGSNIGNVLLVLGVPALFAACSSVQPFVRRNTLFMLAVTMVFIGLSANGELGWESGLVLLSLLVLYLTISAAAAIQAEGNANGGGPSLLTETKEAMEHLDGLDAQPLKAAGYVLAGLVGLPIGAHLTVEGASQIATQWGVSEAVIGLTIVAIGTSLPELTASVMAAFRGQSGLALGNVIGSNVFNLLAVVGISSLVGTITIPPALMTFDMWVMLASSAVLLPIVYLRLDIGKVLGAVFVALYLIYLYLVFTPEHARAAAEQAAGGNTYSGAVLLQSS